MSKTRAIPPETLKLTYLKISRPQNFYIKANLNRLTANEVHDLEIAYNLQICLKYMCVFHARVKKNVEWREIKNSN